MIDVKVLRAAGLTSDQIVRVLETDQAERIARQREQNRIRQRNYRSRNDVTRDQRDMRDPPPPPFPPSVNNPSPLFPSTPEVPADVVGEDGRARLFRIGKTILVSFGVQEKRTGALLGLWLKTRNDPIGILAALEYARDSNVAEPVAYISAVLKQGRNGNGKTSGHNGFDQTNGFERRHGERDAEYAKRAAAEARRQELAAGIGGTDDTFGIFGGR